VADSLAHASFAARLDRLRIPIRLAYIGLILLATLSSLGFDTDPGAVGARFERMLRPTAGARDVVDGVRNVALFIGWGLVWMVTAPAGRSTAALRDAIWTGAALSLAVECMQLLSDTRVASIFDLMTNTAGTVVGALVIVVAVMALARLSRSRSFVGIPASVFALSYGGAVMGEALVPLFREAVVVSGGPFERYATMRAEFTWGSLLDVPLSDFLLFLPAGVFAVAALYESGLGYVAAARRVGASALALFIAAEVAHGFMGIPIVAGSALVHVVAVVVGAMLAVKLLPAFSRHVRGADRPRLLTRAYVAVLILWALRPYALDFSVSGAKVDLIPLRALGMRLDMFSVVDVSGPFLLYLAFGALLAVWPLRLRGPLSGLAPALYLACATELSQIFVAERLLDITDLMIQASGAAVGWVAVRRAGFRTYGAQLAPAVNRPRPDLDDARSRPAGPRSRPTARG